MSRAFTKESDTEEIDDAIPEPVEVLPPGTSNYITPSGAARLKQLRDRLLSNLPCTTLSGTKANERAISRG